MARQGLLADSRILRPSCWPWRTYATTPTQRLKPPALETGDLQRFGSSNLPSAQSHDNDTVRVARSLRRSLLFAERPDLRHEQGYQQTQHAAQNNLGHLVQT